MSMRPLTPEAEPSTPSTRPTHTTPLKMPPLFKERLMDVLRHRDQVAEMPTMPDPGAVLGKYRLRERIGAGASSVVFKAEHVKLPMTVAVKVLRVRELSDPEEVLRQLRAEATLLAQLNHPHIVRVLDFEDEGLFPYLVTEFIEGRSLARLMQQGGRLNPDWAVYLMRQIVEALEAAHRLGIVHRDVKPDNLLLTTSGQIKLADLGLGMVVGHTASTEGSMTGTAGYMAPEQARSSTTVDHRADMYSLGASFYHLLTGQLPFQGRSRMEVILKHLTETPTDPTQLNPAVGPELAALLLRLLAKEPKDRFGSYAELRSALKALPAE